MKNLSWALIECSFGAGNQYTCSVKIYFIFRMLLSYIYIPVLGSELKEFIAYVWNSHRIRAQKDTFLPAGIPDHIYAFPEHYDLEHCGKLVQVS